MRERLALALFLAAAAGCRDRTAEAARGMTGGDPHKGRAALRKYGCLTCHTIPGVVGNASASVGPPLAQIGVRYYIAGALPNTPENLIRFIRHPQEVRSPNAMPDLGVSEEDGRDIAAYLYTLE
jgi:cytochrome c1